MGHTRRFNPSHQWIHQRVVRDELSIQQMDVQTYFFRRTNTNALGQPRSWTDNLLWHHAAHTVDLFAYQTQSPITEANCLAGPVNAELGIPMDMSIQLKTRLGRPLHPLAQLQQRWTTGHLLSLHLRQRHLPGALRRSPERETMSRLTYLASRSPTTALNYRIASSSRPSWRIASPTPLCVKCLGATKCSISYKSNSTPEDPASSSRTTWLRFFTR